MGYLFNQMARGRSFRETVRNAMELGYTEPDPRDDLGSMGARDHPAAARTGELTDVAIRVVVPRSLRDVPGGVLARRRRSTSVERLVKDARERGSAALPRAGRAAACAWARGRADREPAQLARQYRQPSSSPLHAIERPLVVSVGRRHRGRRRACRRPAQIVAA
jgi:hypothetical protein